MSLTSGDTRPNLTGTLTSGGDPVDVTGAALELHIRRPDREVITRNAVIVSAEDGTWEYEWQEDELSPAGGWRVEVQVTFADGGIETFGPQSWTVKPQLA